MTLDYLVTLRDRISAEAREEEDKDIKADLYRRVERINILITERRYENCDLKGD